MRLMVFAYLDNNIGDDLMLRLLSSNFEDVEFFLYTSSSVVSANLRRYRNFVIREPAQRSGDLMRVDGILSIGGSIFNDLNSLRGKLRRAQKILFLTRARFLGRRIFTIGCNLGPYTDQLGLRLTKLELFLNTAVTVRDRTSLDMLSGALLKKTFLGADIVYGASFKKISGAGRALGVSAFRSTHPGENNEENYSALAHVLDRYLEEMDGDVKIFAFDSEAENDLAAAHQIISRMRNGTRAEIVPYLGDIESFIGVFSQCESHIAVRFHSAILADLLGIPFFPVAYSNKMEALINERFPAHAVGKIRDLRPGAVLCESMISALVSRSGLCTSAATAVDSNVHFEKLREYLK